MNYKSSITIPKNVFYLCKLILKIQNFSMLLSDGLKKKCGVSVIFKSHIL